MNKQAKVIIGVLSVVCVALVGALVLRGGVLAAGERDGYDRTVQDERPASGAARQPVPVPVPVQETRVASDRGDQRTWFERVTRRGPERVTVPSGTALEVRLTQALSSHEMQAGDTFGVALARDLVVDGKQVASAGSPGLARVVDIDHSDRVKGREWMRVELVELGFSGDPQDVATDSVTLAAKGTKKRDAAMIGGGAAVGALIGAIAGGGDDAAKGALIGGIGGTGATLATKGEDIDLPSGHALTFRLAEPVSATVERGSGRGNDVSQR